MAGITPCLLSDCENGFIITFSEVFRARDSFVIRDDMISELKINDRDN